MGISVDRQATTEDFKKLNAAAKRFLEKRGLSTINGDRDNDYTMDVDMHIDDLEPYDRQAWYRAKSRALGYAHTNRRHTIAWDAVGISMS